MSATTAQGARTRKAAPEPQGPRYANCRHCEEQIAQIRPGAPWYHVDNDSETCSA